MIALISDVHGNLPALEAVLADIDALAPGARIWCLGDTVGYGASPGECLDLVRSRCEVVLAGNHDLAVSGDPRSAETVEPGLWMGGPGAGIRHALATIGDERIAWLRTLEPSRLLDNVELHHGSDRDPVWEYVRTVESATAHLQLQQRELGAVGHTHMPLLWELPPGAGAATGGLMPDGSSVVLSRGTRRVFNPGSVGQPRDRDPRSGWATLERGSLVFRRTAYDIDRARADIRAAGLPEETGERLVIGW
ncbi:MAG: metallophosphoesterase family protein [Thermoleophilia bacterium]|nr:metallophosphoesterase family protein [Thermoleophilia bacterium]